MKEVIKYYNRYKSFLFFLGLIIVGSVIVFSHIIPTVQKIQTLREEVAALNTKRSELFDYASYLEELASTALEVEEPIVNYALPSENDVVSLIVTYEGLSKREGVKVSPFELSPGLIRKNTPSITPAPVITPSVFKDEELSNDEAAAPKRPAPKNTNTVEELPFKMEVTTEEAEKATDFIKEIYKTRRVLVIKKLSWINPTDEVVVGKSTKDITLKFELGTYYYSVPPTVVVDRELINRGKGQTEFIEFLRQTSVYDQLVLDAVPVGKMDLFVKDESKVSTKSAVTPTSVPTKPVATSSGTLQ